ncbi:MAG: glycoside hydrolase family 99-like domain-containing protein [Firmicutes bacterium]|nr:glycoside hydrolase family 99-like domain-containing protein [Bacillota bacterium]
MFMTKIFAAYLPQYHEIPENNEFWGEGFTDWIATKNAKPQFDGHIQPKVPLNDNYYDLSDPKVLQWQAELARKYKIAGFNIYHYWFKGGKKVLETPAENLLKHPEIDIEYFFSWPNDSWVSSTWNNISGNSWAPALNKTDEKPKILLEFDYEDQEAWKAHFEYLLPFFNDERYLKIDKKPVFVTMKENNVNLLKKMSEYWNELAINNGFNGVFMITTKRLTKNNINLDGKFIFQPMFSAWGKREAIDQRINKYLKFELKGDSGVRYRYDYDEVWKDIIKYSKKDNEKNLFYGGVVGFDDTPRRGERARMLDNNTPEKFEEYLYELYKLSCEREKEILFLTAWNEWGEGSYLEPDTLNGYAYLEAVKNAVERVEQQYAK